MGKKSITIAVISLIFAVIILFLPVMMKWQGIFHDDHGMAEFPIQYSLASNLQKGIVPLWDPHIWCGAVPFNYALIYAGGNYYPLWLFYFFANLNSLDKAYWMISILPLFMHFILGAIGMFILLKSVVKCNCISAVIGALAYIYSPVFVYYYGSTNSLIMLSWLPWLIYVYIKTVEKWRMWKLFLGGIIFAFIWIAGRPHFMPFIMVIWGSVVFSSMIINLGSGRKKDFIKPLLIAFAIFTLGTALSAVYLCPSLDVAQHTRLYTELSADVAIREVPGNLSPSYLITLFVPNLFGGITGNNFIFKPLMFNEANMSGGMATTLVVIFGVLIPFMLFSANIQNKLHRRFAIIGIFLYLFSILCALGGNTPFYRLFIGWIPIVGGLPFPVRYRMIQCFAVSLLIAIGLNYLITSKFSIKRHKLHRLVLFYVLFSFCVIGAVLFLPQDWRRGDFWPRKPDSEIEKFFPLKAPFGLYIPKTGRVKKIRVIFNGESEGEIRYSDTHQVLPDGGTLIKRYYTPEGGWVESDIDIPPNKFLWVYPKSGNGSIGYWRGKECPSYSYDNKWIIHTDISAISLYRAIEKKKSSLFYEFKNGNIVKTPVVNSLLYCLVASFLIIMGAFLLLPKKFGYFLGIIVLIEFFAFGMMAFYGSIAYARNTLLPQHLRYLRPSDHPMLQRMAIQVPAITTDPTLRIATDYPYYDNFVYLNDVYNRFALMGYGVYPLEKRFKHAIETAYGQTMNCDIYQETCFPDNPTFLNNFSVGYFMSSSSKMIFPGEKCVPLRGESNYFVHINPDVLPRAYTIDKVVIVSDQEQLRRLVSGDLRKGVYISSKEGIRTKGKTHVDYVSHFKTLQQMNYIRRINLNNPSQIEVDINMSVPSMLVLTEVWYPGWKATVDGKPAKIYRVNYCQRGIWLDKGNHHVELEFRPLAWRIGAGISLATIGLMIGLLAVSKLKKGRA